MLKNYLELWKWISFDAPESENIKSHQKSIGGCSFWSQKNYYETMEPNQKYLKPKLDPLIIKTIPLHQMKNNTIQIKKVPIIQQFLSQCCLTYYEIPLPTPC